MAYDADVIIVRGGLAGLVAAAESAKTIIIVLIERGNEDPAASEAAWRRFQRPWDAAADHPDRPGPEPAMTSWRRRCGQFNATVCAT
jgi:glycine/D-amino acid oxidase-like deaminating enzyme